MHPTEAQLDNVLIEQKNRVLALINSTEYLKAMDQLEALRGLWELCYGYKLRECLHRIGEELRVHIDQCTHWATQRTLEAKLQRLHDTFGSQY